MAQENYISGWVRCACGDKSPETSDPMRPFRWLAEHACPLRRRRVA